MVPWTMIKFVATPLVTGSLVGFATQPDIFKWYIPKLKKPWWVPPAPVFGGVWPAMYALMGYSSYLVSRAPGMKLTSAPLQWYGVQLGLNLAWQLIFFKARKPGVAQAENLALLGAVAYTTKLFHDVNPLAGQLMLPYVAWTAYANALNYGVWKSNPESAFRRDNNTKPTLKSA